ncbi:sensor histidine kinase [Brevibacterium zhoupengii]|uniref:sensor histidine kinase n=1 Tax=Brevibacterium zhoupengii TaxID=2898795 RepID=UPI003B8A65A4
MGTVVNRSAGRPRPVWVTDALLGAAVAIIMAAVISANHGGRNDPDALSYVWAFGLGSLMLVRRRHPVLVLAITVLGLFAYYTAGYPAVGVAVPIAAALFSAAEFGRIWWAVCAGAVALATSVFFRLFEGQDVSLVVGYELAGHAFLIAGSIAMGDSIRSRRALLKRSREIVALTTDRAQRDSEAKAQTQRIAVARDLHDSLGHSTTVVSLHTDVAREALERKNEAAAIEALTLIKQTTATTMVEVRRTVAMLRASDRSSRSAASLSNIGSLIDPVSEVTFTTDIRVPAALPGLVDTTAFRIIQESVTNIVKHSTATRAHVEVDCRNNELRVSITDNGEQNNPSSEVGFGHGLSGMHERVTALGGTLKVDSSEGRFAVNATLPCGRSA